MNSPSRHNFNELVLVNNIFNININKSHKQILSPTSKDPYFKIPGGDGKYQGQLNSKAAEGKPTYPDNSLYYALNSYNKNLREIMEKDSSIPKGYQEKLVTESQNLLILKNKPKGGNQTFLQMHYGEFIASLYDFNESLSSNNQNIVYDITTLDSLKEASNIIEPAKVIVVYDLYGNIVNPGIQIVGESLETSSNDALYDSEKTILDNIYRTLIIKKNVNKIFYQNDDGTYKLLENKTNFIHELTYNQQTFYFLTHHDAWLYLRSIVAVEAQKVNIKG